MKASLISIGAYAPQKVLTNFDLEKMVETNDEWIVKRTGIKERRIAADNEYTSDLGVHAAQIAIERAGLDKSEIDCIICGTITPDYFCMPSTACVIADKLGLNLGVSAFDMSAACTGFLYTLSVAKSLVQSGAKKNVLVVCAEKLSYIVDWSDRSTCVLFGDGGGAVIISARDENEIIDTHIASDGRMGDLLYTPGFAGVNPASKEGIDKRLNFVSMKGNEVFKVAVNTLTNDVIEILKKNEIAPEKIDLFIPHQANLRIIKSVQERLNFSDDQCVITVNKFGNTSSASIPMAMNDAYESGRLKKGSLVLLDAFGGGFTWGSALLKFGGENFSR